MKTDLTPTLGQFVSFLVAESNTGAADEHLYLYRAHWEQPLGNVKLGSISIDLIQELCDEKLLSRSPKTVRNALFALSYYLKEAIAHGYIRSNPARAVVVEAPAVKPVKKSSSAAISEADIRKLCRAALLREIPAPGLALAHELHLSAAQLCGLQWGDISSDGNTICMQRTTRRVPSASTLGPRTCVVYHAYTPRSIKITVAARDALAVCKRAFTFVPAEDTPIICHENGQPFAPDALTDCLHRMARDCGVPPIKFSEFIE